MEFFGSIGKSSGTISEIVLSHADTCVMEGLQSWVLDDL